MATTPQFDDFSPELDPGSPEGFSTVMRGRGRWFLWVDTDGSLFGVLWTNDRDALGLLGTEGTDPAHQQAGMAEIRRAKANGYTPTEVFNIIADVYAPTDAGAGDLAALLAEM